MAELSYTSRRELDQYAFHPAVTVLVPLAMVLLQVELPRAWRGFAILDLPLAVTLFFAVSRRSQIAGTVTGTVIGLVQDGLTNLPFGVNGIAKALLGYVAASISFAIDLDNPVNQAALGFVASGIQSGILFVITRYLMADATTRFLVIHEGLRAVVTAMVVPALFWSLSRFRVRD